MQRYFFRKKNRIANNSTFREVIDCNICVCTSVITVFAKPNALEHNRLGVSVGRKFGNAVRRNQLKRYAREAFRLNNSMLETNCDIIVLYNRKYFAKNKSAGKVRSTLVNKSMIYAFGKFNEKILNA